MHTFYTVSQDQEQMCFVNCWIRGKKSAHIVEAWLKCRTRVVLDHSLSLTS